MLDEKGKIIQINTISLGRKLNLGKGFPGYPFIDSNRGLLLTYFETGEAIAKFEPKKNMTLTLLSGTYALDNNRIVISFYGDLGVWNFKTNKFTLYNRKGSGQSGYGIQISGVHPDETLIISCDPSNSTRQGLFLHDLQKGTTTRLFNDYEVMSPRFSPDGTRYAFYGRLNRNKKDGKNYMIIQSLSSEDRYAYEFNKDDHGVDLSWSPTGHYLAGVGPSGFAKHSLYIWNNTGKLIACIPLNFFPNTGWPPLWSQDEKSVLFLYMDDFTKKDYKILRQEFKLSAYGL
jgi:tricorn protease-like protein